MCHGETNCTWWRSLVRTNKRSDLSQMIHAQCCNKTEPSECWINIHYLDWLRLFRFITVRQRLVSRGSKNPACWNPTFSIVWLFERKDGWGVRLPLRYYIFFSLPFRWQRISNLDVFTFVLRWILERRANRSVRRTQSLLLERDGSYLQRFAHFTLILFVLFDHFHYRAQVLQKSNSQEDPPSTQLVPTTSNNKRELYGLFDWHVVESNRFWKDTSGHWLQCCSYNYPHFSLNVR